MVCVIFLYFIIIICSVGVLLVYLLENEVFDW